MGNPTARLAQADDTFTPILPKSDCLECMCGIVPMIATDETVKAYIVIHTLLAMNELHFVEGCAKLVPRQRHDIHSTYH